MNTTTSILDYSVCVGVMGGGGGVSVHNGKQYALS